MDDEDFICKIVIEDFDQLRDFIYNNENFFRKDYIFRGIGDCKYDLIPKALRRDEFNQVVINDYIDSSFFAKWVSDGDWIDLLNFSLENFKISYDDYCEMKDNDSDYMIVDKYGMIIPDESKKTLCNVSSKKELQIKRELYILLRFFNWSDKTGLKINVNPSIRRLIHENIKYTPGSWLHQDFFEIISLAQHHGLPTEALDWSYRYESALYFAVKNILKGDPHKGVLWALNYKLLENNYSHEKLELNKLLFYRPQYYSNPNLRAQKGLFTFIINNDDEMDYRPLDEIIIDDLKSHASYEDTGIKIDIEGLDDFIIPYGQKIFYKFIIPPNVKYEILEQLYFDGWSEKFMFPGFDGVVNSMANRVELDKRKKELKDIKKKSILISLPHKKIRRIINEDKNVFFKKSDFKQDIDNIFIYSKGTKEVFGYFKKHRIIYNIPDYLWKAFSEKSILTEEEFFDYYSNSDHAFAVQCSDFKRFNHPIELNYSNDCYDYCYLENINSLKFLLNFE